MWTTPSRLVAPRTIMIRAPDANCAEPKCDGSDPQIVTPSEPRPPERFSISVYTVVLGCISANTIQPRIETTG